MNQKYNYCCKYINYINYINYLSNCNYCNYFNCNDCPFVTKYILYSC